MSASQVALLLASMGSKLFRKGNLDNEAIQAFNTASQILSPSATSGTIEVARRSIEKGNHLLDEKPRASRSFPTSSSCMVQPSAIVYRCGHGCGPRPILLPIAPEFDTCESYDLLRSVILYNKAIVYHSNMRAVEATCLYQGAVEILLRLKPLPPNFVAVHRLLSLRLHNNLGQLLFSEGDKVLCHVHFHQALHFADLLDSRSKEGQLEYAETLSNWCQVHWTFQSADEAIYNKLKKVLEIRSKFLHRHHVDVASAQYNIGVADYFRGNRDQAAAHFEQFLEATRSQDGAYELDALPGLIFHLLIQYENRQERFCVSISQGLRILQSQLQDEGKDGPGVASGLNFVATLFFHHQDFDNALAFFKEELRIEDRQRLNGAPMNQAVGITCNNIGRIFQEQERYEEAKAYYERSLQCWYGSSYETVTSVDASSLSENDVIGTPNEACNQVTLVGLYSTVWYNLGLVQDKLQQHNDALQAFQISLMLRRRLVGERHPDIVCLMYNIGVIFVEQNRLNDASRVFKDTLRVRRMTAKGHLSDFHLMKSIEKLAKLQKSQGNIPGAIEAMKELVGLLKASSELNEMDIARELVCTMRELAELYHSVGELESAVASATGSVAHASLILYQAKSIASPCYQEVLDRISATEQLASCRLLLACLFFEMNEPMKAQAVLRSAICSIQSERESMIAAHPASVSSMTILSEVTELLARYQCAPSA